MCCVYTCQGIMSCYVLLCYVMLCYVNTVLQLNFPSFFLSLSSISPIFFFPPFHLLHFYFSSLILKNFPLLISIIIFCQVVDLIPGGRNIAVTDETKAEYIRLVAHHRMTAAIRSQVSTCTYPFLHSHLTPYGALTVYACLASLPPSLPSFISSFYRWPFLFPLSCYLPSLF